MFTEESRNLAKNDLKVKMESEFAAIKYPINI